MRASLLLFCALVFALGCGGGDAAPAIPAGTTTPAPAPAPPAPAAPAGDFQTHQGELAAGDETLQTGEYADTYGISVSAGQNITAEANTNGTLDPYLILRAPSGQQFENDDFNGSTTQSRIEQVASESGYYEVIVTSYEPGEAGPYTATLRVE